MKNYYVRAAALATLFYSLATPVLSNPALNAVVITDTSPVNEETNLLTVQGKVDPNQNFTSADINGYAVTMLDNARFNASLPPAAFYQIKLYGDNGEYQVIDYADASQAIDSAIQVVIGNQLTTDLGPVLGRLLTDLDLNAVLGIDSDACVVDTPLLRGCDLYIRELAIHGTPLIELSFTPENNGELTINVAIDIPEATLQSQVKRAFWWGYRNTTITTNDIDVELQIGVKPTDNQSIKLVLDESSDVNLTIGKMQVSSNALAPHLIPLFKDAIALVIDQHLAQTVGPFLALLPIPSIPISLPVDVDGDGQDDAEFAINMSAEKLDVLDNNDGLAVLGGAITSVNVYPGREVLGSRRIGGLLPEAASVTSPTDLSANVAVDLVNQVLTAVYQSGLEEKVSLSLPVSSLGDFGTILTNTLGYSLDEEINVGLSFGTAPEMLANNDSLYALGVDASINQLRLTLSKPTADGEEVILDFTSDVLIDTSLGAEADGSLQLEFAGLLAINNMVVNGGRLPDVLVNDFGVPVDFLVFLISTALPNLLTSMEPTINALLNVARLELDIGELLSGFLNAEFPSVIVEAYVTETGVSIDESYINLGVGLDFPE